MCKKYSSIVGPGAVILSAVLFGTMPLMAKQAFTLGSNAYTTAFGRFATGAVIAGLVILLHPKQKIRINKKISRPASSRFLRCRQGSAHLS
jgi:drug/metabolite transporter (DMT)-like permease